MMQNPPIDTAEIRDKVLAWWGARDVPYPCHINRASMAGHPCARFLVHCRRDWQARPKGRARLQMIFDTGEFYENQAKRELEGAGYKLTEGQLFLEDKSLQLTGHLDFSLSAGNGGPRYPVEVKSMQHWTWEKINGIQDMLEAGRPWLRKYPAQLLLYLYLRGTPVGLFYLKSKLTLEPKLFWVNWEDHVDYLDSVIEKLKVVNQHVADATYPEPMEYDPTLCDDCDFLMLCGQARKLGADLTFEDSTEVAALLAKREELAAAKKEYEQVDSQVKALIWPDPAAYDLRPKVACGEFLVTGRWQDRKPYSVEGGRSWVTKIQRIAPKPELEVVP